MGSGTRRLLWPLRMLYVGLCFRRHVLASAMDFAEELEPILRREQVDCVIHDYLAFGAGYAAERLGIPSLTTGNAGVVLDDNGLPLNLRKSPPGRLLCRMPRLVHRVMDALLPLGRARAALGLPARKARGMRELFQTMASPELHIIMIHPGFLKGLPLRDHQLFAGPFAFDGGRGREKSEPPPSLAPGTILVSTTTVGGDAGLLRRVLEAVAPLGLPVLATSTATPMCPRTWGSTSAWSASCLTSRSSPMWRPW